MVQIKFNWIWFIKCARLVCPISFPRTRRAAYNFRIFFFSSTIFLLFSLFLEFISKKHFCGVVAEPYESKSNILHVRFFATAAGINSDFTLFYTAFTKKKPSDGKNSSLTCGEKEFDCDDDTCIDISLVCDEQFNCKFKKDEANCKVCMEYKYFF